MKKILMNGGFWRDKRYPKSLDYGNLKYSFDLADGIIHENLDGPVAYPGEYPKNVGTFKIADENSADLELEPNAFGDEIKEGKAKLVKISDKELKVQQGENSIILVPEEE